MSAPTATEVREFLEGYGITESKLSDDWITNRINYNIIPFIQRVTGMSFEGEETIIEYHSGRGESTLLLNNRNAKELVSLSYVTGGDEGSDIGLGGVILITGEGIVKAVNNVNEGGSSTTFRKGDKNIKVSYTLGESDYPNDIKEAITYLTAEFLLGIIGARTGGGSLTVQGFGRNYGQRGKYQDIRNDLKRQAMTILKTYTSSVVGG